jgi:hypothetical protein
MACGLLVWYLQPSADTITLEDNKNCLADLIVKIFLVGKLQPLPDDLNPFFNIRKHQVLAALLWLVALNRHYHDLILSFWPTEFIPGQISAISDHTEREGYVANLETGNFKNDLQATASGTFADNDASLRHFLRSLFLRI